METLSPSPQCMRTPIPLCRNGLTDLKAAQVLLGRISLSDPGFLAELLSFVVSLYALQAASGS